MELSAPVRGCFDAPPHTKPDMVTALIDSIVDLADFIFPAIQYPPRQKVRGKVPSAIDILICGLYSQLLCLYR